jgi:RNA-directed DNA polymerase
MTQDSLVDIGDNPTGDGEFAGLGLVARRQYKLHRLAVTDPGHRFDDLFNLVAHPLFLKEAWWRVANNRGARSAGSDGVTVRQVEMLIGTGKYLEQVRMLLKQGLYRPQLVRERLIPKPGSNKKRRLGIPTVMDRIVQASLKLVLEPIFEADFSPVSYGFRPNRRAHDAIAEVHHFGTKGYQWVLEGDIEACFDRIDHTALIGRVRSRVKDKRVVALVKAFLKAGILTELGDRMDTDIGTPQGGILSPLLANIALTVLDEAFTVDWQPGQAMSTTYRRSRRRQLGQGNWRMVRYADDFVVMCDTNPEQCEQAREIATRVLQPMGLTLSPEKTLVTHMKDGFDFLGFHIQWRPKRGTNKWYVYTFPSQRAIKTVKQKIHDLTRRTSQANLEDTLIRLNQILKGWANYFRHGASYQTFNNIRHYVWNRIVTWQKKLHRWNWRETRQWLTNPNGTWKPISAGQTILFNPEKIGVTRYRYRGNKIPNPFHPPEPKPT